MFSLWDGQSRDHEYLLCYASSHSFGILLIWICLHTWELARIKQYEKSIEFHQTPPQPLCYITDCKTKILLIFNTHKVGPNPQDEKDLLDLLLHFPLATDRGSWGFFFRHNLVALGGKTQRQIMPPEELWSEPRKHMAFWSPPGNWSSATLGGGDFTKPTAM